MARIFQSITASAGAWFMRRSRSQLALLSFALVLATGYADYITGPGITLSVIYVIPISLSAWFVGPRFAFGLAILSVGLWLSGDVAAGKTFSSYLVPAWNGTIRLTFYVFVVI